MTMIVSHTAYIIVTPCTQSHINTVCVAQSLPSEPDESASFDQSEEEWIDDEDLSKSLKHDIGEDSEPDDAPVPNLSPQSLVVVRWLTLFFLNLQAALPPV